MDAEVSKALLELNRRFYRQFASQFNATRRRPWPGWERVLARCPASREELSILDLGCGNGRFAIACDRFLRRPWRYLGIDDSPELLAAARTTLAALGGRRARVRRGDLLAPEDALPAGPFDLVVLFGVLHHVPGRELRRTLLARALARVAPAGRLVVSYWQLGEAARLMERTVSPEALSLPTAALGPDDHLLRWGDGEGVRYCHHCGPAGARRLAKGVGARVLESFRSDGESGRLNLYHVLAPGAGSGDATST